MRNITLLDQLRSMCRKSFYHFVKEMWSTIIPEPPVWSPHIKFLCDRAQHGMERIFKGLPKEKDLVVNQPPSTTKSIVFSIMLPAWGLTRMKSLRTLVSTHTERLGLDLSRKSRNVVKSEKFRDIFPGLELEEDQDTKGFWVVKGGGERQTATVGGKNPMGSHAHLIITDDPIDPTKVLSKAHSETAIQFMEETLPSRKIDQQITWSILVMQRLGQGDPTANKLKEGNVEHICLPAEESDNISPPDARRLYTNGLLDPVRLPQDILNEKKKRIYYYAGQYCQCLVAGTLVLTKRGQIAIEDVTVGDFVLTRCGWKSVLWSGETKKTNELVSVLFDNGSELMGTPDHPVFSNGIWKSLDSLCGGDYNVTAPIQGEKTCDPEDRETKARNQFGLMERNTCEVEKLRISQGDVSINTKKNITNTCIEMCGDTTTGTSPKASISIIKTKTLVTMRLKILNACLIESIRCGTLQDSELQNIVSFCIRSLEKVMLGTKQRKDKNITENMDLKRSKNFGSSSSIRLEFVSSVNESLGHVTIEQCQNTAQLHAEKRSECGDIGKFVNGVERYLSLQKIALNAVLENVERIGETGIPVYDVSVEEKHEFYANGILVHNCPVPREGGTFQINRVENKYTSHPPLISVVRFWDTALTKGAGAYTVGWKMGDDGQNFWILHVARERKEPGERNRWIKAVADMDGKDVEQCIEQPNGFGKESAEATARILVGHRVRLEPVKSNKETRWDTFADAWNVGAVNMMLGEWNQEVIDEYEFCPNSVYKDQLDAGSDCFARLIAIRAEKEAKERERRMLEGELLTNNIPKQHTEKIKREKLNRQREADTKEVESKVVTSLGEVEIDWDQER